jgi:putative hydrolase of the HAD superfamily
MGKAILFDMGGTLEEVVHTEDRNPVCGNLVMEYLARHNIHLKLSAAELMARCEGKNKEYRRQGVESHCELSPFELWSEWYLKDLGVDQEKLKVIAENLANIWERNFYSRSIRKETRPMLEQLAKRGVPMGVISNTGSLTHVIENLHEYGIHQFFKGCIYLSSLSGYRKPGKVIFIEAAADLGAAPEEAVYVGDTVSRDVRGARSAGYLATIRIQSQLTAGSDAGFNIQGEEADYVIKNLLEIPGIIDTL